MCVTSWGNAEARIRSSRPSTVIDWSVTRPWWNPNEVRPPASPAVSRTRIGQGVFQLGSSWPSQAWAIVSRHNSACSATRRATSAVFASTTKLVER